MIRTLFYAVVSSSSSYGDEVRRVRAAEKPPDSGFQPDPTSVLMFGSLLTIVVARGAAFGEKAAAEPSASARTVLAIAVDLRVRC